MRRRLGWQVLLATLVVLPLASGCDDSRTRGPADLSGMSPPDLNTPVQAPTCKVGRYDGTFAGHLTALFSSDMGDVTGSVSLTILASVGEVFTIGNGHLSGIAKVPGMTETFPYSADLEGTLNCETLALDNGLLTNGKVVVMGYTIPFVGTLTADYDPGERSLTGAWMGKDTADLAVGSGTWKTSWKSL